MTIPPHILDHAIQVFGSEEAAYEWLTSRQISTGGIAPALLLSTPDGVTELDHMLGRTEWGVL